MVYDLRTFLTDLRNAGDLVEISLPVSTEYQIATLLRQMDDRQGAAVFFSQIQNYDIPVVWIVHNNAKLGLVHELQKFSLGEKTVSTTFKQVNFAKIAEGLGAQGFRIEKPGELSKILPQALESKKPTVIDCIIDPHEVPPLERWVKGVSELNARLDYL